MSSVKNKPSATFDGKHLSATLDPDTIISKKLSDYHVVLSPSNFEEMKDKCLRFIDDVPLRKEGITYEPHTGWNHDRAVTASIYQVEGGENEFLVYHWQTGRLFAHPNWYLTDVANLITELKEEEEQRIIKPRPESA